ncbi:probable ADP-ribosylation factor GTPase-activating protein AGD14 isoform X2 [Oryza brachyantha]|uniref:Arf-GAP domain-containing protein n=1 Tax=Oryza brachyantha TaxID=4533 RepID=J3LNB5_ORYBR|nr:probable ADP-ribosylation factor GTPase-activating protein AGD14 isoform X2 [Oryza brachyantha]
MAAASRKEEERNERVVRGLLKLPPNRRCINCNALGPQYVCTSFWTFVCISCSGIHREFTHRVKSVSMSTFTTQEVEALQNGGNQRARESFLKEFDAQNMRLPDSSHVNGLREFIKAVYVERRYAGGRFSERPPRDKQNQKNYEQEHRRANSYHSFSQSPPYDYHYEERRNGKQSVMLTRKPGSDRGHDGKMSGFAYSPQSLHGRMSEDRFANENCGPRTSDCSGSTVSDTFRTAPESPNFLDKGCSSPSMQQNLSNMQASSGINQSELRTISTGNMDSASLKSGNSSLADMFFESDKAKRNQQTKDDAITPSFTTFSDAVNVAQKDLFNEPVSQQQLVTVLDRPVDLFANMLPATPSADKMPTAAPSIDNPGWATFDTPPEEKQPGLTGLSGIAAIDKQALSCDLFQFEQFEPNNGQPTWLQSSKTSENNSSVTDQSAVPCKYTSSDASNSQAWSAFDASVSTQESLPDLPLVSSVEPNKPIGENNLQLWHSFDDASETMTHNLSNAQLQSNVHKRVDDNSLTTSNPFNCSIASKESIGNDSQELLIGGFAPNEPFAPFPEPSPLFATTLVGGTSAEQMPLNPFDLPFDADKDSPDTFMDVTALQAALPNAGLSTSFVDGLPETWFPNNTAAYVPPGSHGGPPCLVEQIPNSPLRNITLSAVSTGNPFA